MTDNVARLPVQHKQKPHCASCKGDLPTLDGMEVVLRPGDIGGFKILAVTLQVECPCGAQWCLRKIRNGDYEDEDGEVDDDQP